MTTTPAVRLAVFAAGLVVVFGVMFGVGKAFGPWEIETPAPHGNHQTDTTHTDDPGHTEDHGQHQ